MAHVYYIWGVPGSGKSTLARYMKDKFRKWDLKYVILDDDVMMNTTMKQTRKFVKQIKKRLDFIVICSVVHPLSMGIKEMNIIGLLIDEKLAMKRHAKTDKLLNGRDEEKEYRRYWRPWAEVNIDCSSDKEMYVVVGKLKAEQVFEKIYKEFMMEDLLNIK